MRLLHQAALAAYLCAPAFAREPQGPACMTADTAYRLASEQGATLARLDGAEAQTLLDRANEVGQPTDYHAQTVIVVLRPTEAIIAMFDVCHQSDIRMHLSDFKEIWVKARGVRV